MEIDPVTQMPKEEAERQKEKERQDRLVAEGEQIESALASPKGKKLISEIEKQLEARLEHLLAEDQQCVALVNLLIALGVTSSYSKMYAKKIIEDNLRR